MKVWNVLYYASWTAVLTGAALVVGMLAIGVAVA